MHEFFMVQ